MAASRRQLPGHTPSHAISEKQVCACWASPRLLRPFMVRPGSRPQSGLRLADAIAVHSEAPTRPHGGRHLGPAAAVYPPRRGGVLGPPSRAGGVWEPKNLQVFEKPRFSANSNQNPAPTPLIMGGHIFSSPPPSAFAPGICHLPCSLVAASKTRRGGATIPSAVLFLNRIRPLLPDKWEICLFR